MNDTIESIKSRRVVFTITSGRSGTKLLTKLLECIDGVCAEHEGKPRMNFVFRAVYGNRDAARAWLLTEMYPAIAERNREEVFIETSHLFCKGFIEPTLELGLRPRFLLLSRPAHEVATSFYSIGCIPERTDNGRLVLLGPSDSGVQKVENWHEFSDYQLCYWYAKEIERRQYFYERWLPENGCEILKIQMKELTESSILLKIAQFVTDRLDPTVDFKKSVEILSFNQNSRENLAAALNTRLRLPLSETERLQQQSVIDNAFNFQNREAGSA